VPEDLEILPFLYCNLARVGQ